MAVDERRRSQAYTRLAEVVGEEAATTMFELLPPAGADLARTTDVVHLEGQIDRRFEQVEQRFEQIDQRFEQIDQRFEQVDRRFEQVDQRFEYMNERMADGFAVLRGELLAAFRGEIVAAVSGQTRAIFVSVTTTIFGLAALALAVAQLL